MNIYMKMKSNNTVIIREGYVPKNTIQPPLPKNLKPEVKPSQKQPSK